MSFFDYLKWIVGQSPRILMGVVIFCIIVINLPAFNPGRILFNVPFLEMYGKSIPYVWLFLFLSLSLLISHGIFVLFPKIKSLTKRLSIERKRKQRLHNLSSDEKEILRDYREKDTRTRPFSMFSGLSKDLEIASVLYKSTIINDPGRRTYDYNISSWAWDYLKKHPELLE